jgi:hypothetical protein
LKRMAASALGICPTLHHQLKLNLVSGFFINHPVRPVLRT